MSLEEFIENLNPELKEKARECSSAEELLALAKEADVPVPDEALAAIAGGNNADFNVKGKPTKCPRCGSTDIAVGPDSFSYVCLKCGYTWW